MTKIYKLLMLISMAAILPLRAYGTVGGLDGGGGLGGTSTPEQVRTAIEKAYELLRMKDYFSNVFLRFWVSEFNDSFQATRELDPTPLFPSLKDRVKVDVKSNTIAVNTTGLDPKIPSPALDAVLARPPELRDSGDCAQSSRSHADASTSSYTIEGVLCFSVGNLTRIPPQALMGEILGLILHEAFHLSGMRDETVPELWQSRFVRYFQIRFGALDRNYVYEKTVQELTAAHLYLVYAEQMNGLRPGDPKVLLILGAFGRGLAALPYFLDPIAMQFALEPKNPQLNLNYSNSVLALYNLAKTEMFYAPLANSLEPVKIKRLIKELDRRLDEVRNNFYAYSDGETPDGNPATSVCRLPKGQFELEISFDQGVVINLFTPDPRIFALIPPQECSPGTEPARDPHWVFVPKGEVPSFWQAISPTKKKRMRR